MATKAVFLEDLTRKLSKSCIYQGTSEINIFFASLWKEEKIGFKQKRPKGEMAV